MKVPFIDRSYLNCNIAAGMVFLTIIDGLEDQDSLLHTHPLLSTCYVYCVYMVQHTNLVPILDGLKKIDINLIIILGLLKTSISTCPCTRLLLLMFSKCQNSLGFKSICSLVFENSHFE